MMTEDDRLMWFGVQKDPLTGQWRSCVWTQHATEEAAKENCMRKKKIAEDMGGVDTRHEYKQ